MSGDPVSTFALPACAGVFATALTHPLDVWVVHAQTGRLSELRANLKSQGPRVLMRGILPACGGAALIYSAMQGTFGICKHDFGLSTTAAAAASALPESIVRGPAEAIKNLQQTSRPLAPAQIAKGTLAMVFREVPGNCAYFNAYENVLAALGSPFLGGCAAGAAFTVVTYPIDAVRSQIVTGAPVRLVFTGMGLKLVRDILITALLFWSLEMSRSQIRKNVTTKTDL